MSEYERKHDAAIKELEATEMWPSNYAPPIYHFYRKLGLKVRPPHYDSFVKVLIGQGVFFGLFWGIFMWFFEWRGTELPIRGMVLSAVLAGVFFGCAMALFSAYGRRKWSLSAWEDL